VEGILGDEVLGHEPVKEGLQSPAVGVDGMTGEFPVLGGGVGMAFVTGLVGQVDEESSELLGGYGVHAGGEAALAQEALQVDGTGEGDGDGVVALPLGAGAEAVGRQQRLQGVGIFGVVG